MTNIQPRYYVVTETLTQVDDSPFESRESAQSWIDNHGTRGIRYSIITQAEVDVADEAA